MAKFPVELVDIQILELFKFFTAPDPKLEFVEEMIQVCMENFGHEDVDKETETLFNHKSYKFLRELFLIKFNEDITLHLKDNVQMIKDTQEEMKKIS